MFPQAQNLLVVDCGGRSWEYYHPSSLHLEVVQKAVSALAVVALLDLGFATLGRADEISRHGTAVPRWWLRMVPRETITIYHHSSPHTVKNHTVRDPAISPSSASLFLLGGRCSTAAKSQAYFPLDSGPGRRNLAT